MVDCILFFCKQKTAYELRISDWGSDVCSSDLDMRLRAVAIMGALGLAGCTPVAVGDAVTLKASLPQRPPQSADLSALLARMSLERKEIGRAPCRERVCRYV